jgi:hypothetical protein
MGTVFRGRDIRTRRPVAVKLIAAATADEAARFAREAEILAGVVHPGVVGHVAHAAAYLVMQWVDGETLRARLDRAPVAADGAVAIARQLADALAALHAAGIVHRDVKPANTMLDGDRVVLVDFGVARSDAMARVTRTGISVGTAGYMAPEQARGEPQITGAADVFALGCVLYECLSGAPAFRGDSATALRALVLLHDPPPLRAIAPALPAALDALVSRMLARDPAARPTARDAAAALGALDAGALRHLIARDAAATAAAIDAATEAASGGGDACAVVIALDPLDDGGAGFDRIPALAGGTPERFAGGAVATRRDPGAAAALALAVAAELPGARIAIARGRSVGEAIARGAQLLEQLAIAAATGESVAGAWLDGSAAGELSATAAAGYAIEPRGDRLRLRGSA